MKSGICGLKKCHFQFCFTDWSISPHEDTLKWMPRDLTDDKSTLVQVILFGTPGTKPLPEQMLTQIYICHHMSSSGCNVLTHWGRDKMAAISQTTFSSAFSWMGMFKFRLRFVPKGPIDNIPALVQIIAWHWPCDKPLSEPMMVSLLTHICVTRPWRVNVKSWCCFSMHIFAGTKAWCDIRLSSHPIGVI